MEYHNCCPLGSVSCFLTARIEVSCVERDVSNNESRHEMPLNIIILLCANLSNSNEKAPKS